MKRFFCVCLFFLALVGVLSVSAAQNVVSLHKGYTLSPGASQGYPDENYELTNGKYGTPVENGTVNYYYRDTEYVGFRNEGEITVVLDLGEVYTVDPESFVTMGRATPFAGHTLRGKCLLTVVDGQVVYKA